MPHFQIDAIDQKANVMVTSVIRTEATMAQVRLEVKKGGLHLLKIRVLSPQEVDMYERMRIMTTKRNMAGELLCGKQEHPATIRKIRWGRVFFLIILPLAVVSLLLFL